jgi:Tfp pilus assembly protein PilN
MNLKTKVDFNWMLNRSSLCLILWDDGVDVVWTEQSVLGLSVRLMERIPMDDQPFETIAEKLSLAEKMPARVLLCLPRPLLMQRTLDYPATVQSDLENMIQFEAARHVPLPEADRRIAYASARWPEQDQLSVNLTAARQSAIAACIKPLEEAGIPIDCALAFAPLIAPPAETEPTVMVISDTEHVEVALFADGLLHDSLLVDRPAEDAAKETLTGIVRRIAAQHRERLGAEGIGRVVFAGPVPLSDDIQQALSSSFGLPVHGLDLPEEFRPALDASDAEPLMEALCAVAAEPPLTLNLIDQTNRKVPWSRRTLLVAGLCALFLIELSIGWAVWTNAPAAKLKAVNQEIAQIKRRAAPVQTVRNQNRDLRRELNQLNELGRTRVSSMKMLKILSDALPDDTYLEGVAYQRGDDIRIRGRSKEPDKLPQLIQDLAFIETIEASEIEEKQNDYYRFTLSAALRSMLDE